jgi:hypothetical protein
MTFAPVTYFAMGATYAAVTLTASDLLGSNPGRLLWVFPASVIVMCAVPSLVFIAVDPPTRTLFRERSFRQRHRSLGAQQGRST